MVPAKPITDICNLSKSLNKFRSAFKLAKAKGRKTNMSIFRPISLLPILSKVNEKVVHEQTTKLLNDNNIFYKYQSGSEITIRQTYFYHSSITKC